MRPKLTLIEYTPMSVSVPKPFRMNRSPMAITCCARACGSLGSPNASDSRKHLRREHGPDQRREERHHPQDDRRRDNDVGDDDAPDAELQSDDQRDAQERA